MPPDIDASLIAPCGVNCLACSAYVRESAPCPGCRAETHHRKSCQNCVKKRCAFSQGLGWCFECGRFPCARIRDLSGRYARNYGVDLIENGYQAREDMAEFLRRERERFTCPACGGVIDQHHRRCSGCGAAGE